MIYFNGTKLDFEVFPNGETRVNGGQIENKIMGVNEVVLKYENDSDLIRLMFVKRYLDSRLSRPPILYVTYMPYSRMDRVEGNSVFTLKYVAEFINSLKFHRVTVVEPHSDVSLAVLDNVRAEYPTFWMVRDIVETVGFNKTNDYLFFPDAGAQKRYGKMEGYNQLVGYKQRDFDTGRIKSLDVLGAETIEGAKVIIIDDLCSYGGTFMLSGKRLKELGAAEIYLVVAHAEKSIFEGDIFKEGSPITKVFCTNSISERNAWLNGSVGDDKIQFFELIE